MEAGTYLPYIVAAYAVVALGLAGFIGWLAFDGRRQQRLIDDLEARGVRRRSGRGAG